MELLEKILSIASIVTTWAFPEGLKRVASYFRDNYRARLLKKILKIGKTKGLIALLGEDFKSEFVTNDIKEKYFFVQTGIETNWKSIGAYIRLKDQLGGHFTWDIIREAKAYLNCNGAEITVNLKRHQRYYFWRVLVLGLIYIGFIIFVVFLPTLANEVNSWAILANEVKSWAIPVVFLIVFAIVIYLSWLIQNTIVPLHYANTIEDRLYELEK